MSSTSIPTSAMRNNYYTNIAGAHLKRYQCQDLLDYCEAIEGCITSHNNMMEYFEDPDKWEDFLHATARETITNQHGFLICILRSMTKEVWFPAEAQTFKQLCLCLKTLEEYKAGEQFTPEEQETECRDKDGFYRILLDPCLRFLMKTLQQALDDRDVWIEPTGGQAMAALLSPPSRILVPEVPHSSVRKQSWWKRRGRIALRGLQSFINAHEAQRGLNYEQ